VTSRLGAVVGWSLAFGLAAVGVLNVVPAGHPSGDRYAGVPGQEQGARGEWFIRRDRDDLVGLAAVHGRFFELQFVPYLRLGEVAGGSTVRTYVGSLEGQGASPEGTDADGAPAGVLSRQRLVAFAGVTPTVEDYDPQLDAGSAARLEELATLSVPLAPSHWISLTTASESRRIVVVPGDDDVDGDSFRVMVDDESVFIVDEAVLDATVSTQHGT
jgi:hypothetical protein